MATDFGGGDRISLKVGAEAAVFSGNGDAEEAGAVQIPVIVGREFCLPIVSRGTAGEHGLAELAGGGDDSGLFVVEPECSGIEDRRIQIDLIDISRSLVSLHRHHTVTCVAATLVFRN